MTSCPQTSRATLAFLRVCAKTAGTYDALDPNGSGESFLAADDAERMLAELEAPTSHAFKWSELTAWFKSAREEFDDWDPDASSYEEHR